MKHKLENKYKKNEMIEIVMIFNVLWGLKKMETHQFGGSKPADKTKTMQGVNK